MRLSTQPPIVSSRLADGSVGGGVAVPLGELLAGGHVRGDVLACEHLLVPGPEEGERGALGEDGGAEKLDAVDQVKAVVLGVRGLSTSGCELAKSMWTEGGSAPRRRRGTRSWTWRQWPRIE